MRWEPPLRLLWPIAIDLCAFLVYYIVDLLWNLERLSATALILHSSQMLRFRMFLRLVCAPASFRAPLWPLPSGGPQSWIFNGSLIQSHKVHTQMSETLRLTSTLQPGISRALLAYKSAHLPKGEWKGWWSHKLWKELSGIDKGLFKFVLCIACTAS